MTANDQRNLELAAAGSRLSSNAGLSPIPTSAGSPADSLFECAWCGRQFKSKIGLGVHKRSAHPEEYFAETAVSQKKARWTDPENHRLAEAEAEIVRSGRTININQQLQALFPARTLESIKSKRKAAAYKKLVDEKLKMTPPPALPPPVDPSPPPAPPPAPDTPPVSRTQSATTPKEDEEVSPVIPVVPAVPVVPEDIQPDVDPWRMDEDTLIIGSPEYYLDDLNTDASLRPPPTSAETDLLDKAFRIELNCLGLMAQEPWFWLYCARLW